MLSCPFCNEDDFDEIGLCMHLSTGCPAYDRACRLTSDYIDDVAPPPRRPAMEDDEFIEYDDDREACPLCGGDGGDPGNDYVLPCPECDGEGWVPWA